MTKAKSVFFSLVVILSFVSGLILGISLPRNQTISTNTSPLSVTPVLSPDVAGTSTEKVIVTKVVDGDTIKISTGQTVRLIGIDTPEITKIQCYGKEATEATTRLLLDKEITLEKDVSETDRYGRILRYVWLDDKLTNETLVREGFAHSYRYKPDTKYQEIFDIAEAKAREEKKGLWSACTISPTQTSSIPTSTILINSETTSNSNSPSNTTSNSSTPLSGCLIKGNISGTGSNISKIYHLPSCGSYERTVIDESAGEHYFCTEEEAVGAGWRKAKNC